MVCLKNNRGQKHRQSPKTQKNQSWIRIDAKSKNISKTEKQKKYLGDGRGQDLIKDNILASPISRAFCFAGGFADGFGLY